MNKLLLKLAMMLLVCSIFYSTPGATQESPTTEKAARVRITQGPELELAKDKLVIIRWTSNNPGGSPEHYGIVRYGTDPTNLSETAKSPIRLNPVPFSACVSRALSRGQPTTTRLTRWRPMARAIT
jgi:hypothetical protein